MKTHQSKLNANSKEEMYIINLDYRRIFWFIAISLFTITFFFLLGYWFGSDIKHSEIYNQNLKNKINFSSLLSKEDIKKIENIKISNKSLQKEVRKINEKTKANSQNKSKKLKIFKIKNKKQIKDSKDRIIPAYNIRKNISQESKIKKYIIQISSHKIKNNAIKLKNKLSKKGFNVKIKRKNFNSQTIYKVTLGVFYKYNKAKSVSKKLKTLGIEKTLIKRI